MTTIEQNEAAARRCVELFNLCTNDWVETCYAPTAEWIELPQPSTPAGRQGDRAFLGQASQSMLRLFPDRQIKILNLVAQGDQVVLELDWMGTAAASIGNLKAGFPVHLRVASILTFAKGLIVKQVDYCIFMPGEDN